MLNKFKSLGAKTILVMSIAFSSAFAITKDEAESMGRAWHKAYAAVELCNVALEKIKSRKSLTSDEIKVVEAERDRREKEKQDLDKKLEAKKAELVKDGFAGTFSSAAHEKVFVNFNSFGDPKIDLAFDSVLKELRGSFSETVKFQTKQIDEVEKKLEELDLWRPFYRTTGFRGFVGVSGLCAFGAAAWGFMNRNNQKAEDATNIDEINKAKERGQSNTKIAVIGGSVAALCAGILYLSMTSGPKKK